VFVVAEDEHDRPFHTNQSIGPESEHRFRREDRRQQYVAHVSNCR